MYKHNELYIEDIAATVLAREYGTPCFVYSQRTITENWNQFSTAFGKANIPCDIFYAVKANSNLSILGLLASMGSGFDCVSGGEVARVLKAGGSANKIVFSGVGKSSSEIEQAINLGIHSINVESAPELSRIEAIAKQLGKIAKIALRVNPDIDAGTHSYITTGKKQDKFGVSFEDATEIIKHVEDFKHVELIGLSCHIGSQITSVQPFISALERVLGFIDTMQLPIQTLNIGGGLGVVYKDEQPPTVSEYAAAILKTFGNRRLTLHIEPGRTIVANAGILLTKIEYIKNNFVIVDAAMNDLIRPALYNSYHAILPVTKRDIPPLDCNVVGPICESGDFLGKERSLAVLAGDLLAIQTCGAYCFSASSNYNSRPRAAELLVNGGNSQLIRKRETLDQLWENEICAV